MKEFAKILIPIALSVGGYFLGMFTVDKGMDREAVSDLLRAAGDSAVTAFRSGSEMENFVSGALSDTVDHYQAEVRAATRIVVRRETVTIRDTVPLVLPVAAPEDTVEIVFPLVQQEGITLAESLTVHPPPDLLQRRIGISFDADTIIAAILRTPEGVDRFAAAGLGPNLEATVIDAAQIRTRNTNTVQQVIQVLTVAGCFVSGYALSDSQTQVALISGGVCAAGAGISLFIF